MRIELSAVAVVVLAAFVAYGVLLAAVDDHRTPHVVPHLVQGSDAHYCNGCTPPLVYGGGPTMLTNSSAGLTVTPVYWVPAAYALPSGYESIIDGYVHNLAAASGTASNVYSIDTEYYAKTNGVKTYVTYNYKSGNAVVDTSPYPTNGCSPLKGFTACITDAQLRTELRTLVTSQHLPVTLAHFYPVFFPPNVETQDLDGTNSSSGFCGYHRSFPDGAGIVLYGNEPFLPSGCGSGQAPNGSLATDGAIDTLSHEVSEAVTDPVNSSAWTDSTGHEIGDICGSAYGPPLGSTSTSHPSSTEYNQVINGAKYYTQEEFSDLAYSKQGVGQGCQQSEAAAQHLAASSSTDVASIFSDATPLNLPANGTSTTTDRVVVADNARNAVAGDHVTFSDYVEAGSGQCGSLSDTSLVTDANGAATVTYTASTDSVMCVIVATEADGGRSSQSIIYQGAAQASAPTASSTSPSNLEAGGSPTTFEMTFKNPSRQALNAARVDVNIFPGTGSSKSIKADQVALSASTTGPNGSFTTVPLTGTTSSSTDIEGSVGKVEGATIAPHGTETVTFKLSVSSDVPLSTTVPLLSIGGYLDQVNSASGSGTTLASTGTSDVTVATVAPSSGHTWWFVLAGVALVALAGGGVAWVRARRRRGRASTAATSA